MKMRPRLVTGIAAAALAVTACGIAAGSAGGTPGENASSVSVRQALTDNTFTAMRDLAQAKRHAGWNAGERARMRQPQIATSPFTDQGDLAQVKRDIARNAAERARGG
jgi:hypothetical protein